MLITPIVNNNGDRIETLLDQSRKVYEALHAAKNAMCEAMPHGRNYQCNPPGDYQKSRDEMYILMGQMDAMLSVFRELSSDLCDQRVAKMRR